MGYSKLVACFTLDNRLSERLFWYLFWLASVNIIGGPYIFTSLTCLNWADCNIYLHSCINAYYY